MRCPGTISIGRRGRRASSLLTVAGVLALFGSVPAAATAAIPYVEFFAYPQDAFAGGAYVNVPASQCASGDCPSPDMTMPTTYEVISTPGASPDAVTVDDGYTLTGLLADAGIAQAPNVLVLSGTSGPFVVMDASELTATPAPVVWSDSGGLHFADSDPSDYLTVSGSDPVLWIDLYPGNHLQVGATIAADKLKAGEKVNLAATASGQESGEQLTYHWEDAAGGQLGGGQELDQALPAGSYQVYAEVTGSDGSIGYSQKIGFTVGDAPKGPSRQGGGTAKRKTAPTSGPGVKGSPTSTHIRGKATVASSGARSTVAAPAVPKASTSATAPRASTTYRSRQQRQPVVAGEPLSGAAIADSSSSQRTANAVRPSRMGTTDPARTGHVRPGLSEDAWIALAALAAAVAGGLLQDRGARLVPHRRRPAGMADHQLHQAS